MLQTKDDSGSVEVLPDEIKLIFWPNAKMNFQVPRHIGNFKLWDALLQR